MGQKIAKSPEVLIKHYQEQMSACEMSFVENAYEAGKVLIAQKNKLDHGEFSDWCREHWKKSRRTAAEYMLLAENLEPKQVSECVSIRQAKKLLPPNRQRAANLNQELPVNGDISAEIESKPTSGDSPPITGHSGAVESSVERQPGDESEEGGVSPEPASSRNVPLLPEKSAESMPPVVEAVKMVKKLSESDAETVVEAIVAKFPGLARKVKTIRRGSYTSDFEAFWAAFPSGRKTKKGKAFTAWKKAIKGNDPVSIIDAAAEYANSDVGQGEFVQGPEPWLNGSCWEDDRSAWNGKSDRTYKQQKVNASMSAAQRFVQKGTGT